MSLRHVLYVLNDERFKGLPPTVKHLLTVLAACASDRGNVCWPAEGWLMSATGLSRASIYRAKSQLRDLIEIDPPGYKRSNCYYLPPVDAKGKRLTEVGKVLAAKREQELEAKGELPATVDNVVDAPSTTCSQSHSETLQASQEPFLGLCVRRLPSHCETGEGLTVRPEVKDESEKKSGLLIPSHGETSHGETSVDKWAGETPPRCEAHYDWIRRHCRIMGMDATHTAKFFAQHRPWGWNALKPGVTVCDLIADYVTMWQQKFPNDYRETVDAVRNGSM